ncbi:uncharacterized protein MONBRDRAFT_38472 [Monosiga brevicollis MX1]|uniref:Uncharacterized protein n=1 Tax=Monosiga brevicollis TaxID=81824 RepID=A9V809_MONBE|nr:uncharacterized protein MONBRDRAFT_38472 [Monosiga brevicollis MX1]EDQ86398.1 predicted protein [Monosiga brevicollis MX1]|eukprot:XP_001748788.1 hypothetical protein [Monosiga brevicollis MX1]
MSTTARVKEKLAAAGETGVFDLSDAKLHAFPNLSNLDLDELIHYEVLEINLSNNKLVRLPDLSDFEELEALDCSRNALTDIEKVARITSILTRINFSPPPASSTGDAQEAEQALEMLENGAKAAEFRAAELRAVQEQERAEQLRQQVEAERRELEARRLAQSELAQAQQADIAEQMRRFEEQRKELQAERARQQKEAAAQAEAIEQQRRQLEREQERLRQVEAETARRRTEAEKAQQAASTARQQAEAEAERQRQVAHREAQEQAARAQAAQEAQAQRERAERERAERERAERERAERERAERERAERERAERERAEQLAQQKAAREQAVQEQQQQQQQTDRARRALAEQSTGASRDKSRQRGTPSNIRVENTTSRTLPVPRTGTGGTARTAAGGTTADARSNQARYTPSITAYPSLVQGATGSKELPVPRRKNSSQPSVAAASAIGNATAPTSTRPVQEMAASPARSGVQPLSRNIAATPKSAPTTTPQRKEPFTPSGPSYTTVSSRELDMLRARRRARLVKLHEQDMKEMRNSPEALNTVAFDLMEVMHEEDNTIQVGGQGIKSFLLRNRVERAGKNTLRRLARLALQEALLYHFAVELINLKRPDSVPKVYMNENDALSGANLKLRKNVDGFLEACRRLQLNTVSDVSSLDILQEKNTDRVISLGAKMATHPVRNLRAELDGGGLHAHASTDTRGGMPRARVSLTLGRHMFVDDDLERLQAEFQQQQVQPAAAVLRAPPQVGGALTARQHAPPQASAQTAPRQLHKNKQHVKETQPEATSSLQDHHSEAPIHAMPLGGSILTDVMERQSLRQPSGPRPADSSSPQAALQLKPGFGKDGTTPKGRKSLFARAFDGSHPQWQPRTHAPAPRTGVRFESQPTSKSDRPDLPVASMASKDPAQMSAAEREEAMQEVQRLLTPENIAFLKQRAQQRASKSDSAKPAVSSLHTQARPVRPPLKDSSTKKMHQVPPSPDPSSMSAHQLERVFAGEETVPPTTALEADKMAWLQGDLPAADAAVSDASITMRQRQAVRVLRRLCAASRRHAEHVVQLDVLHLIKGYAAIRPNKTAESSDSDYMFATESLLLVADFARTLLHHPELQAWVKMPTVTTFIQQFVGDFAEHGPSAVFQLQPVDELLALWTRLQVTTTSMAQSDDLLDVILRLVTVVSSTSAPMVRNVLNETQQHITTPGARKVLQFLHDKLLVADDNMNTRLIDYQLTATSESSLVLPLAPEWFFAALRSVQTALDAVQDSLSSSAAEEVALDTSAILEFYAHIFDVQSALVKGIGIDLWYSELLRAYTLCDPIPSFGSVQKPMSRLLNFVALHCREVGATVATATELDLQYVQLASSAHDRVLEDILFSGSSDTIHQQFLLLPLAHPWPSDFRKSLLCHDSIAQVLQTTGSDLMPILHNFQMPLEKDRSIVDLMLRQLFNVQPAQSLLYWLCLHHVAAFLFRDFGFGMDDLTASLNDDPHAQDHRHHALKRVESLEPAVRRDLLCYAPSTPIKSLDEVWSNEESVVPATRRELLVQALEMAS